jgi:hypothetical protein
MNLLQYLEPLIGRTAPAEAPAEPRYALAPFFLLANRRPPFDAGRRPESRIQPSLEPVWRAAAAGCQLCACHAVNAVTVGSGFAERILASQVRFLDQLQTGLGAQHEAEIRRLYEFASRPLETLTRDGRRLEIPSEWRMAVDFLLNCPESPYRNEDAGVSSTGAPTFPDEADVALALDLEHAWQAASEHFGALVQALG